MVLDESGDCEDWDFAADYLISVEHIQSQAVGYTFRFTNGRRG